MTCKKCGEPKGETGLGGGRIGAGRVGADTQDDELHVLFTVRNRDGFPAPWGAANVRGPVSARRECETRLARLPWARSMEAKLCDTDLPIARVTRMFAGDTATLCVSSEFADALLVEPCVEKINLPSVVEGFVSGTKYYDSSVGGGIGTITITKEEAQRKFDEKKRSQTAPVEPKPRGCTVQTYGTLGVDGIVQVRVVGDGPVTPAPVEPMTAAREAEVRWMARDFEPSTMRTALRDALATIDALRRLPVIATCGDCKYIHGRACLHGATGPGHTVAFDLAPPAWCPLRGDRHE